MRLFDWLQMLDGDTLVEIVNDAEGIIQVGKASCAFHWYDLDDFNRLYIDGYISLGCCEGNTTIRVYVITE